MVSSARNPNESYAQRAKKASTSLTTQQKQQQQHDKPTSHAASTPPSSLKPPQVNVWAERIKEQKANAASAVSQMPRQRATSSPQPVRDDEIQHRSSKTDLATQLAILDQRDEHDPFVVRVPPHLSRRSSSSTNPLPVADHTAWPHLPGADPHSNPGRDTPLLSTAPSRQNSITSFRHNAYSPSSSARLPRVQSTLSQHSHSASQSRTQSRSGSSASSPRLQIRARTLPHDDDLRLDRLQQRSSHQRSTSPLSDPPNHISASFRVDPIPHSADPSYHRTSPIPPLQDMSPHYAQSFVPQYAFPQQFQTTHIPGHNSPTYISPHSGQATPPYPHYPPYPAYMYGHHAIFWGDYPPPHSHSQFQSQPPIPSNHLNASEHPLPPKTEFGSASSAVTTEPEDPPQAQRKPSKSVVFGTIGLSGPPTPATPPPATEEQHANTVVDHVTEQFATFSIGVSPDEPGPSRLGSRKSSVRSLSRTVSAQPTTNEDVKDVDTAPAPLREVNGSNKPVKWAFGTTHSEDLDDSRPSPPTSTSLPVSNHQSTSGPSSPVTSRTNHLLNKSEAESPTSDVWVVKDYGYGFGDHSGLGNAPQVARWEMNEREKERARDKQREREMFRDQYRDRNWVPGRQPGWRHENGVEEGRDGWEQRGPIEVPRHMRPRRGSLPGYGGHERGGFTPRRGRAFGGRFQGGRGRGAFTHHRPGSYPYAPPPPPPPFEVLPPAIDIVNGYGQLPYVPPELESHEAIPPVPQPFVVPNTSYLVEAAQNCLMGQLEYYLSPQNMAQDFYLRQRMDDEGWIPISLLASFKRVRQLHTDADAVRGALSRSRVVEVNGDWVRMGSRQWETFVLPNAPRSVVTGVDHGEGKSLGPSTYHDADGYTEHGDVEEEHGEIEGDCDGEDCEGDDEDDDVEFVIGEEAEGSWMPVPERKQ